MARSIQSDDDAALALIGDRIARHRIARSLSQRELAEQAGLGLRTVQRLEQGAASTNLAGLIRVVRVLGLLDHIDRIIPEPSPSPIAQLRSQRKQPKRVRHSKPPSTTSGKKWTWADDT